MDYYNMSFWESEIKTKKLPWEEFQPTKEDKEVEMEHKEEDLVLLVEEIPSFVEEEKENKVIPSLEEKMMAFEPSQENEVFLQEEGEEDQMLQQIFFYDMQNGKESLKEQQYFRHARWDKFSATYVSPLVAI